MNSPLTKVSQKREGTRKGRTLKQKFNGKKVVTLTESRHVDGKRYRQNNICTIENRVSIVTSNSVLRIMERTKKRGRNKMEMNINDNRKRISLSSFTLNRNESHGRIGRTPIIILNFFCKSNRKTGYI